MLRRLTTLFPLAAALLLVACSDSPPSDGDDACEGAECRPSDADDVGGDVSDDVPMDGLDDAEDGSGDAGDPDATDVTDVEDGSGETDVPLPPLSFTIDPEDGATFVPLDVTITVQFNQPMKGERMYAGNLTLSPLHGDPITRKIRYDGETHTLTVEEPDEGGLLRPVTPYQFRMSEVISTEAGEQLGAPFRSTFSTTGYPGRIFLRQIAEAYAPVVYQQVETARVDTFTRIDYDGTATPIDNLNNARNANYGYAYYDVIESVSHFFITYLFYYPGTTLPNGTTYEHDVLAVQVVVKKEEDDPLGTLRAFSTFYHEALNVWTMETGWYSDDAAPTGNNESIDGRLRASDLEDGRHISIFVESGRHAACLPNVSTLAGPCSPNTDDETAPFDAELLGLVVRAAEESQRVGDAPNDQLTYSLRSFLEEYWALRGSVGAEDAIFGGEFAYNPPAISEGSAVTRPGAGEVFPTSLNSDHTEGSRGDLPFVLNWGRDRTHQGTWFVDPAWANLRMMTFPESFSPNYCFNPYLNIDQRDELRGCTPTDFVLE
jgi:hypothetical protein